MSDDRISGTRDVDYDLERVREAIIRAVEAWYCECGHTWGGTGCLLKKAYREWCACQMGLKTYPPDGM